MQNWFAKNGFNEEGTTYVVMGDSYSIKDKLKAAGFKYDPDLKWHAPTPADFQTFEIKFDEIYIWDDEMAIATLVSNAYSKIEEKRKSAEIFSSDGDFYRRGERTS